MSYLVIWYFPSINICIILNTKNMLSTKLSLIRKGFSNLPVGEISLRYLYPAITIFPFANDATSIAPRWLNVRRSFRLLLKIDIPSSWQLQRLSPIRLRALGLRDNLFLFGSISSLPIILKRDCWFICSVNVMQIQLKITLWLHCLCIF